MFYNSGSEAEGPNASTQNQTASASKGASSFLKPSKLDWGASSVFKTVQSNSVAPTSKPDVSDFFREKIFSYTGAR